MSLRQAFLRDVLEHPEDDTVRLIFADWLHDHDDPRGEFIHTQIRLSESISAAERLRLQTREKELLRLYGVSWLGSVMPRLTRWVFRRGFVEEIVLKAHTYLDAARELLEREPVRCVRLSWSMGEINELAGSAMLSRLSELDLSRNYLNDAAVEVLAESPHLQRLAVLRLANNFIRRNGARVLADSPHLHNLRLLDLSGNVLTAGAKTALRERFGEKVQF